ncbi:MAG: hypothetical protein ACOYNC_06685 [Bacteroidales bacterium]
MKQFRKANLNLLLILFSIVCLGMKVYGMPGTHFHYEGTSTEAPASCLSFNSDIHSGDDDQVVSVITFSSAYIQGVAFSTAISAVETPGFTFAFWQPPKSS